VCFIPRRWRSLLPIDGLLVIELLSNDFELVPEIGHFVMTSKTATCIILYRG
jgi:hypothetical protein